MVVDRLPQCRDALQRLRREGAVTLRLHALSLLGLDDLAAGEWERARATAAEHVKLSEEHDYRLLQCRGLFLQGMLAAATGDDDTVATTTDRLTAWAIPRRVAAVERLAAQIRTLAALGCGRYEEAYRHAVSVSPAGQLASHVPHALWLILDLTEAAVHAGRHADAAAAGESGIAAVSPRFALHVAAARALVADDRDAPELFAAALAVPGAERWAFEFARVRLLHGERLRRTRATTDARVPLTRALDTFRRLGAQPWCDRASTELRATGLTPNRAPTATAPLTPQQRQIAALAASGLTNKEIAERLFLSPRTVSTHLYQIFPKLGITSRAALRDALTGHADRSGSPGR
jgi:DNA-binding CsgD family transcriptional regulator